MNATYTKPELNRILAIGIADAVLLVVLMYFAFVNRSDNAVHVLGPLHGIGFLTLLVLFARGASEGKWEWWFPLGVMVTGGPLGSIIGDVILRRRLDAQAS